MAFLSADQRELFLPLVDGIHESPPFGAFMRNLVARTNARRAYMILTLANAAAGQEPAVIHVAAPRAAHEAPLDFRRIEALRLHPYGGLRPERVYALDEMLAHDDPVQRARQQTELDRMGIRFGRWLRVSAGGVADAWLLLVREREDFSAAAVATLSAIAPHLAASLRTLVALIEQRLQTAMAHEALARLGIGQLAFDAGGRVMAADACAEAELAFVPEPGSRPGRRLQLLPEAQRMLEAACAELATAPIGTSRVLRLDERNGRDLLLRKAELPLSEPAAIPAVIGTLRNARREVSEAGSAALMALHGLSAREADLAQALSRGETITGAGLALNLTAETARNYSKRIYAKTGTSGQADLVRLVLGGLAPLA